MIAMTMLLGADWDDDDQPDYRKYFGTRFAYKLLNRTWRELASMFSFSDFDSLIGGGAIPMWSLARDMVKLLGNTVDEARDAVVGEDSKKILRPQVTTQLVGFHYFQEYDKFLNYLIKLTEQLDKGLKKTK